MKVLLLGATGLLGHNVLQSLVDDGHQVVAVVREGGRRSLPPGGWTEVVGSPLDYDVLLRAAEGCDAVVNCAGVTDMSLRRLEDYLPVNRDLCALLVRLLDDSGITTLVHTSTVNTIGNGVAWQPADETAPMSKPFADSLYARSKREGELVVLGAAREGRHVVVVNPGFMLGAWDVKPSSGRMLLAAYRRRVMFAPRGGKAFVHVADVARSVANALTMGENGARYIVVGDDACLSIADLYRLQAEVCGYRQQVVAAPGWLLVVAGAVGDLLRRVGVATEVSSVNIRQLMAREYYDNGRARRDLALTPRPIGSAIKDFHDWKKNNT